MSKLTKDEVLRALRILEVPQGLRSAMGKRFTNDPHKDSQHIRNIARMELARLFIGDKTFEEVEAAATKIYLTLPTLRKMINFR